VGGTRVAADRLALVFQDSIRGFTGSWAVLLRHAVNTSL